MPLPGGREHLVRPGSRGGLVDGANMVLMATSLSWVPFPPLATDLDLQQTLRGPGWQGRERSPPLGPSLLMVVMAHRLLQMSWFRGSR